MLPDKTMPAAATKTTGLSGDLRARVIRALGHSVSSPKTQRAVAQVNKDLVAAGRRPAVVTRRGSNTRAA